MVVCLHLSCSAYSYIIDRTSERLVDADALAWLVTRRPARLEPKVALAVIRGGWSLHDGEHRRRPLHAYHIVIEVVIRNGVFGVDVVTPSLALLLRASAISELIEEVVRAVTSGRSPLPLRHGPCHFVASLASLSRVGDLDILDGKQLPVLKGLLDQVNIRG